MTPQISYNVRVMLLLEENDLWDIFKDVVPLLIDSRQLASHKRMEVRTKHMTMDAIKYHLIPHIFKKNTTKEMFNALVSLY
jgi:hypothetical protein